MKFPKRWRTGPGLAALGLYLGGMVLLLVPTSTSVPGDGQFSDTFGHYSHTCGVTITAALHAQRQEVSADDERAWACARHAERLFGFGLLLVLLALPPAAVAVTRPAG